MEKRVPSPKMRPLNVETMDYYLADYKRRIPLLPDGSPEKAELLELQEFTRQQRALLIMRGQGSRDDSN